ncbi:MAG: OmpA family protein, partial [Pseudomonadota bacterium]
RQRREERQRARGENGGNGQNLTREERRQRREERQRARGENGGNGQNLTREERRQRREERRRARGEEGGNGQNLTREERRQRREERQRAGGENRQNLTQEERRRQREERRRARAELPAFTPEVRRQRREEMLRERRTNERSRVSGTGAAVGAGAVGAGVAAANANERGTGVRDDPGAASGNANRDLARKREVRDERRRDRAADERREQRRAEAKRERRRELREDIRRAERRQDRRLAEERRARVNQWERRQAALYRQDRRALRRDVRFFANTRPVVVGPRAVYRVGPVAMVVNPNTTRFRWRANAYNTYELNNGWRETVVVRPGGVRVVTVTNRYGVPIRRYRAVPGRAPVTLFNNLPRWWGADTDVVVKVRAPRVRVPYERYVVDASTAPVTTVYDTVTAEPVDDIDRSFTLNQVLANPEVRDYMPRVDLDTITFRFGSAEVPENQIAALETIGAAIEEAIDENPSEVYLIEGHTDAVGSELDNLELSDARAEAVAEILTEFFEIPPENLVTQGFGEAYLKVQVEGPNRKNRRVAIRRITPLLSTDDQIAGYDEPDLSANQQTGAQ